MGPDASEPGRSGGDRPTTRLTWRQLVQISAFWFALNATWGAFELFQQKRSIQLTGAEAPLTLGAMEFLALPIAILTMPVMGSISDYTTTRFGRRRPYVLVGGLAVAVALVLLALAPTVGALIAAFFVLQFTTNFARGPFAGLVPDLVPEEQVGTASGLMGLLITLGLVGGFLVIWIGYLIGEDFQTPMLVLAGIIALVAVASFLWIPSGPPGRDRAGRSWPTIALETFGTDILHERDYLFLLGSRFCILMGTSFFMNLNVLYLRDTFGVSDTGEAGWVLIALAIATVATAIGTVPGARLSDRVGRKPVIYASAVIGAIGMTVIGLAPTVEVAMVGVACIGLGGGAFLAVDWALMTDIIPKAAAGRYMGMSNIVEASNGPLATTIGGFVMYTVGLGFGAAVGARTAMLDAILLFVVGSLLLTRVHEPHRTSTTAPRTPPVEGKPIAV